MNEHLMITKVETEGDVPKGEPVASPPAKKKTICNPQDLLMRVEVEWEDVELGDWVAASYWSRPRRVEHVDLEECGNVLYLAEPDVDRANKHGFRRVDREAWDQRGQWRKFPALRLLWEAAHSEK